MHFIIGSWCIVCLAIDVVNFSLFGLSIAAIRISQTRVTQAIRTDFRSLLTMPIQTAGLVVVGPGLLAAAWFSGQELQQSIAQGRAERQALQHADSAADSSRVVYVSGKDERLDEHNWSRKTKDTPMDQACSDKDREALSPPVSIQVGISAAGYHWKGAAEPVLEIHEFTDFECPHCRNAHMMVSRLVSSYPDQIRVYHRHLPLDHHCNPQLDRPFHPRACELSRIAVCAGRQGRFFEMVDYLFHNAQQIRAQSIAATDIARSLALDLGKFDCCMTDAQTRQPIDTDLQEAAKLNLRGTPAFVIDGRAYYGKIPEEALKKLGAAAH
jgi:predicted DsbA family dithiol-disulfide isomerase